MAITYDQLVWTPTPDYSGIENSQRFQGRERSDAFVRRFPNGRHLYWDRVNESGHTYIAGQEVDVFELAMWLVTLPDLPPEITDDRS